MKAKWTVMVYLAGNNSLSGAASEDLHEMQQVGSSGDVNVAAFVKQAHKSARRLFVGKQGETDSETLPADTDSGSPQTVVDFARWAIKKAPAERYALILWNHGGGWTPDDFDELYTDVRGAARGGDRHESNRMATRKLSRALFKPTIETVLAVGNAELRAICSDDVTGHSLDTVEVARILAAVCQDIGQPLDLFGMDACLMSTLEVAYEVQPYALNVVGSEELEPGSGWCYDTILRDLTASADMDGASFAKCVVRRYVESYGDRKSEWPITQCAVQTRGTEEFSTKLDALATALKRRLATSWSEVVQAQARATSFEYEMKDLKTFCESLAAVTQDAALRAGAREAITSLDPGGSVVLAEGHLGTKVEKCGGISLYFPGPTSKVSPYYKDLEFSKRHGWNEFLAEYLRAVKS